MADVRPIDANALSEQFGNDKFRRLCKDWIGIECLHLAHEEINISPTLDYAPVVHAHWIYHKDDEAFCSACMSISECVCYDKKPYATDYCPHCGARMDEPTA